MQKDELRRVLTDRSLAQLGDSILNFTFSAALTQVTGKPQGRRVKNGVMTPLIDASKLKELLPMRTSRRDRANAFEAIAGYLWLQGKLQPEEFIRTMVGAMEQGVDDREEEHQAMQACFKLLVDRLETNPKVKTQT